MPKKRIIDARSFLEDLRSGMKDADLMAKYSLTGKGLQSALRKMVAAGVLDSVELESRSIENTDSVGVQGLLGLDRNPLDFPLPIYDENNPEIRGIVHDITEKGVGTVGIRTRVHDVRVFAIPANEFFLLESVVFEAKCRWTRTDKIDGSLLAGFEIIKVSRGSLRSLRKLIRALTFMDASSTGGHR